MGRATIRSGMVPFAGEFILIAIDEFDQEIAKSRNNSQLMALLEARVAQSPAIPLDEVNAG